MTLVTTISFHDSGSNVHVFQSGILLLL